LYCTAFGDGTKTPLQAFNDLPLVIHILDPTIMGDRVDFREWVTDQQGLDRIQQRTVPAVKPGAKEVLVKVGSVSLNYRDTEGMHL